MSSPLSISQILGGSGGSAGGVSGSLGAGASAGGQVGAQPGVAYSGSAYASSPYTQTHITPTPPDWRERAFVLKNTGGKTVGIYKGPLDVNGNEHFTLYLPNHEEQFQPLSSELLDPMDFETHTVFETFPVLEVVRYTTSGTLLKIPD